DLWLNLVYWTAATARAEGEAGGAAAGSGALEDPIWTRLRDQTGALAGLQSADGSLAGDAEAARSLVSEIASAIEALTPRFPHGRDYLELAVADLRRW